MKLPIKFSRSRSNSPPPSPSAASTTSPTAPPKKLRFPFRHLGRSSSRKLDSSCEISSPKPPIYSPFSRTHSHGKAKVSETSYASHSACDASPSVSDTSPALHSVWHGKRKVSKKAMHEIRQVFVQFDTNGDGKISAEELRAVLASMGDETTSEEAALMVREVDIDGDGYIDLGEFVDLNARCLHRVAEEEEEEEMAAAFAIFDLDKNGRITAEELQEVLCRLGGNVGYCTSVEDCKRMIRGIDRKGTGHVDFDDFKHMMTPLTF